MHLPKKYSAQRILATIVLVAAFNSLGVTGAGAVGDSSGSSLTRAEVKFLKSAEPKVVTIDPASGRVKEVGPDSSMSTLGVRSDCSGDVACWSATPPLLQYGFNGSGASGNWTNRGAFYSKNYTATVCWRYGNTTYGPSVCTPEDERVGRNSRIEFGQIVTGTAVNLRR